MVDPVVQILVPAGLVHHVGHGARLLIGDFLLFGQLLLTGFPKFLLFRLKSVKFLQFLLQEFAVFRRELLFGQTAAAVAMDDFDAAPGDVDHFDVAITAESFISRRKQ